MGEINTASLSVAQIVPDNLIVQEKDELKREYLSRLNSYVLAGRWNKRKFEKSELQAYEKIVMKPREIKEVHNISFYKYFLVLDVIQVLGYEVKSRENDRLASMKEKLIADFEGEVDESLVDRIIGAFKGKGQDKYKKIIALIRSKKLENEADYIKLMLRNVRFKETKPVGVIVTATMSAGKSAFINSLTGKYICLSRNMACTSKIHNIVNKAFEDGYSYEYDHDLEMTAGREELMNDNALNTSDRIVVGTHFSGFLEKQRIVISDSPGVNYSENEEHRIIAERLIKGRNYHLLIYVMNATQLSTSDEEEHLNYIKSIVGRTPVFFVINKIDSFNVEEEDLGAAIRHQKKYLEEKGFRSPVVCPVSARAGYLSKRAKEGGLSKLEERELYNFIDKFDKMNLPHYYEKTFKSVKIKDLDNEEEQLYKTCGLAYVEKLIISLIKGGN